MGSFYRSQHEMIFVFKNSKGRTATTCSWAGSVGTVPRCGDTPEPTLSPGTVKKEISLPCIRQGNQSPW